MAYIDDILAVTSYNKEDLSRLCALLSRILAKKNNVFNN